MSKSGGKKIFVSRRLAPDSPFHQLTALGHTLTAVSLIKISYVEFEPSSTYDAVFFYSQKAIQHFLKRCAYDSAKQYGVMGKGSAAVFHELIGQQPDIIGKGEQAALAAEINNKWKGKRVVFPQAQESMRSLEELLPEVTIDNLVVYTNEIDDGVVLGDFDVLAFTSPLNVKAYLRKRGFGEERIVAIGGTTAGVIKVLTGMEVVYCAVPSEEGLFGLVLEGL